jgi:hypothetical protein
MSLKWGHTYHVELHERIDDWLEEIRYRHPHYTSEEILYAAVVCGLDWLRRDEKLAWRLKKWYPPVTTADRFPFVAFRILSGKICTHIPKRPPRLNRGFYAGDGCGPW